MQLTHDKGFTIDCKYVKRVKDIMRIHRIPIILLSSGEDDTEKNY